jgi:phage terminase large subunit-like protein
MKQGKKPTRSIRYLLCADRKLKRLSLKKISVRAKKGKWLRAEPVAALFEQGRVKLAGAFPALEDEMCDFGLDGLSSGRSPDRLDAMVWAVTALSFGARGEPRVRGL